MSTVNLVGVNKVYDNSIILNDINLKIQKGEFVALVGSSGSGKSTLLRLVAGLDNVSSGNILINGKCVNKVPASKRDMAMVFQNYALYPHMSVYANMAYGLKMRGMKKTEIREKVEVVSKMLQLNEYLDRLPASLSGGQRQRVAMGRAIVRSPAVFLFDEPLSNLDAKLRTEMRQEIKKLHMQLNTTCLYVTHDQTEAMTLADRVVIINKGRIEQVGSPQELFQSPATVFVASFIGHYAMNFIPGVIEDGKIISALGLHWPIPFLYPGIENGEKVIIGVRPENIKIDYNTKANNVTSTIEWIDDLGSDKIVRLVSKQGGVKLLARVFEDIFTINSDVSLEINISKASLFSESTRMRIGGWE